MSWRFINLKIHIILQSQMRIPLRDTTPSLRRNSSRHVKKNLPRSTLSTLVWTYLSTLLYTHTQPHWTWKLCCVVYFVPQSICISQIVFLALILFPAEKLAEAQRRFATLQNELQSSLDAQRESWANGRGLRRRKTVFALSQQERCKHRNIKDLQLAFSEFYLSLILLQNYQVHTHKHQQTICNIDSVCLLYLINIFHRISGHQKHFNISPKGSFI